jgi:hypothetical protein
VERADFPPVPEIFAAVLAIDVALLFVFSFAAVGPQGELNLYEVPRALLFVPLVLAFGMIARWGGDDEALLRLPVAVTAGGIPITVITSVLYLLSQHQWLPYVATYWTLVDHVALLWWGALIVAATLRLVRARPSTALLTALAGVVLLEVPAYWLPQGLLWAPRYDERAAYASGTFHTLADERAFYAQEGALERELAALRPERPGHVDVYVVAAALYAGEDVFMKDVELASGVLADRFGASGRVVKLVNNAKTLEEHPIASLTSIAEALRRVGETMNREEDVLVLFLTSHGTEKHELAVDFRPLRFVPLDPQALKKALAASGIRWRVVVISACYSGGFVEPLKDERTLIITASHADRQSFGCGTASESTYLTRALFGEALKKTQSLELAFAHARALIEQWEREERAEPSMPQLFVGTKMRAKLGELEQRDIAAARR